MNCPNCGAPLFPGEPRCRKCGAPSNWNPATTLTPIQPTPEPVPQQPVEVQPKKSNSKVFIAIIVLIILVLVAIVLLIVSMNNSNKKEKGKKECDCTSQQPAEQPATKFSIAVGKFVYSIPISFATKVEDGYLKIMDRAENPTWFMTLTAQEVNFDSVTTLSNDEIQKVFLDKGATTVTVNNQTVNGKPYLVVNCVLEGNNVLYAYTKANSTSTFVASITTVDNTFGASYLNTLNTILSASTLDETQYGFGINALLPNQIFAS